MPFPGLATAAFFGVNLWPHLHMKMTMNESQFTRNMKSFSHGGITQLVTQCYFTAPILVNSVVICIIIWLLLGTQPCSLAHCIHQFWMGLSFFLFFFDTIRISMTRIFVDIIMVGWFGNIFVFSIPFRYVYHTRAFMSRSNCLSVNVF